MIHQDENGNIYHDIVTVDVTPKQFSDLLDAFGKAYNFNKFVVNPECFDDFKGIIKGICTWFEKFPETKLEIPSTHLSMFVEVLVTGQTHLIEHDRNTAKKLHRAGYPFAMALYNDLIKKKPEWKDSIPKPTLELFPNEENTIDDSEGFFDIGGYSLN